MSSFGREKLDKLKGKVFFLSFSILFTQTFIILPNSVNKTILGINVWYSKVTKSTLKAIEVNTFYDIDAGSVVSWKNLRKIFNERWLRSKPQILQKKFAPTLFLKCIIKKQTLNKIVAAPLLKHI